MGITRRQRERRQPAHIVEVKAKARRDGAIVIGWEVEELIITEQARGNYKIVARLFNMEARDYKRFLNFLRKHDCELPFKEFRQ